MRAISAFRKPLVALGIALVVCACGQSRTPITFDEPLPFDPGPDVGGPALQRQVFADGEVTFDENERAVVAAVQCMRDEGFDVEGPLRYPVGPIVIEPGMDPTRRLTYQAHEITPSEDDRWGDVSGRCQAQWSYAIETIYLRQYAPTEEETRAWLERAGQCLEEQGVELSDTPTEHEAAQSVAYGCRP